VARISQGEKVERNAWVSLRAAPGQDADSVTIFRHQTGVVAEHTLYTAHHRQGGIMQQNDSHAKLSVSASCEAWIARSIYTADDQPNTEAALGGFSPVSGW